MAKNETYKDKITWVNLKLSEKDKEVLRGALPSVEMLFDWLDAMCGSGFRFNAVYDAYSSAIQVSVICVNVDNLNCGLGVSSRNPDFLLALASLWYKVREVLPDDWHDMLIPAQRGELWD